MDNSPRGPKELDTTENAHVHPPSHTVCGVVKAPDSVRNPTSASAKMAELDEVQAEIKIARKNINNLRYADDTTFMAENKEELKRLLMKVPTWHSVMTQKGGMDGCEGGSKGRGYVYIP